jgi:membrane fusion protein (multidrug efflux system)
MFTPLPISNGKTGTAKKVLLKLENHQIMSPKFLSGLSANDIIVTEGVNTISEGMKLNF